MTAVVQVGDRYIGAPSLIPFVTCKSRSEDGAAFQSSYSAFAQSRFRSNTGQCSRGGDQQGASTWAFIK